MMLDLNKDARNLFSLISVIIMVFAVLAVPRMGDSPTGAVTGNVTPVIQDVPRDHGPAATLERRVKASEEGRVLYEQFETLVDSTTQGALNRVLGPYAYGWIDDVCKDKWRSSEPESSQPQEFTSDPGVDATRPLAPSVVAQIQANPQLVREDSSELGTSCQQSFLTTMNVYAKRRGTSYVISSMIQACNSAWGESVYRVLLMGAQELEVESGSVRYTQTKSNQLIIQSEVEFTQVCIIVEKETDISPFCNVIN